MILHEILKIININMSYTNHKIYIDKQNIQRNSQGNSHVKSRISSDENKSAITFLIFIIIFCFGKRER